MGEIIQAIGSYRLAILIVCLFGMFAIIGFGLYRMYSYREGGRGYRRLEEQANAMAREVVGRAVIDPINASVNLAGSLVGAMDGLTTVISSMSELVTAMAIRWDMTMLLITNGKYHEAAQSIVNDPRIVEFAAHRRLVKTLYLIAYGQGSPDAQKIKDAFPYVLTDLEPFPVLPPFERQPDAKAS